MYTDSSPYDYRIYMSTYIRRAILQLQVLDSSAMQWALYVCPVFACSTRSLLPAPSLVLPIVLGITASSSRPSSLAPMPGH